MASMSGMSSRKEPRQSDRSLHITCPREATLGPFASVRTKSFCWDPSSSSLPGTESKIADAKQIPPPGFAPATHDVILETFICPPAVCKHGLAPNASAPWPNNNSTAQVCLFDIEKDPTESNNLAPTRPVILRQMVTAFEAYQLGAVDDISCKWGGDQDPFC